MAKRFREYGKPESEKDAIDKLVNVFLNDVAYGNINKEVATEAITEQYMWLTSKKIPAYLWILEAMISVSRKAYNKRNLNYIVGILRYWSEWGIGQTPSKGEETVLDYFEEVAEVTLSGASRQIVQSLMGAHGAVNTTRAIGEMKYEEEVQKYLNDPALMKALVLQVYMQEEYISAYETFGDE